MEIYGTTTYEEVGYKVAYLGDTDGDGQQDVGITSIDYADTGALHVMTGLPDDGSYAVTDVCQAISSTTTALGIGEDVAPMGDIDGDGYDDFALGAYGDAEGGKFAGAVYIVKGPPSALSTIEDSFAKWTGTEKYQYASKVSGNADMDGDGNVDLAIGSFPVGIDSLAGTAWIIRGPFEDGHHSLADADAAFTGESLGDAAGSSVAMLADANGDGYSDLVVGAVELDDASGAAYLILGSPF